MGELQAGNPFEMGNVSSHESHASLKTDTRLHRVAHVDRITASTQLAEQRSAPQSSLTR